MSSGTLQSILAESELTSATESNRHSRLGLRSYIKASTPSSQPLQDLLFYPPTLSHRPVYASRQSTRHWRLRAGRRIRLRCIRGPMMVDGLLSSVWRDSRARIGFRMSGIWSWRLKAELRKSLPSHS